MLPEADYAALVKGLNRIGVHSLKEYWLTPHWRTLRRQMSGAKRYRCESCGATKRLTLHHRHYRSVGREKRADVMWLCAQCHRMLHDDPEAREWLQTHDVGFAKSQSAKSSAGLERHAANRAVRPRR